MDFEIKAKKIEMLAVQSLLYEVAATPKPGLVDSANTGAHTDMDIFTFLRSATAIGAAFSQCFMAGTEHRGALPELLPKLRRIGIAAEREMFDATGGVNTHKGILFSMGVLCGAAGVQCRKEPETPLRAETLCDRVTEITAELMSDFKDLTGKENLTYGEKLYLKHGITGIRGEVAAGFPTVRRISLPVIREHWGNADTNTLMVEILLRLMAHSEDSNILGRHDPSMLSVVQDKAREIVGNGGAFTEEGLAAIEAFDAWCIRERVSPGGSADMLAITIFLQMLEQLC